MNSLFRVVAGTNPALEFVNPRELLKAWTAPEAEHSLRRAGDALASGYWIAGYLAYELGPAFLRLPMSAAAGPLLALGIFDPPSQISLRDAPAASSSPLLAGSDYAHYAQTITTILRDIADGEIYQANYSVPFALAVEGNPFAFYARIAQQTGAKYQAYVESDDCAILSWSPELFLEFDGDRISTRPMKGTAPLDAFEELRNEKNRAEHLMIVDLLRNDLHRFCDDVEVRDLFSIERYPTFATTTSTIAGTIRAATSLLDVFRATFPCGSVTGAPKRAAVSHIEAYERRPRGAYCGSVGFLSPQRRGWWNVAIRTAQVDPVAGFGTFHVGSGIVSDSTARAEWDEILLKSRFLENPNAAFAVLETFASDAPAATKALHVARLQNSARAFGIANAEGFRLPGLPPKTLTRIRLSLDGKLETLTEPLESPPELVNICIATARVNSRDPFLRHKTSWRPNHDAAAREAAARNCFDALLRNERDELTEGWRTNIFFKLEDGLYTPPLDCGVLPGILRAQLLAQGRVRERAVTLEQLRRADAVYVGNSARGLLRAELV